jgi:predicted GNAT superfamily acetyltransferase
LNSEIVVRPLTTLAEMAEVERLQKVIWQISNLELTSVHILHAIQHNGGMLYGAFDGDKMVGFVLGIIGTIPGEGRRDQVAAARLKLYSMEAGVLPEYQNQNIGYQLKLAQREFAMNIGLRLITWTYDPLESRNGRFNVGKLGAVCHNYYRNFHGELSGINAGLPTDRFEVEWWITNNRVEARVVKGKRPLSLNMYLNSSALLLNETTLNEAGLPVPPRYPLSPEANLLLVEIPSDFQAIKQRDFGLALAWREHTRHLFEEMFQANYTVTDFVYEVEGNGRARSFYLLTGGTV